ncbi:1-deoxy-D-xylulose-5-phosphate synthase [bacterium]|nr:1-deoxy-D-xylulose-5-phosphate synthase [bacterium]
MADHLSKINSPADLKKLDVAELNELAQEIRDYIINNVSVTGGHLAPSLGVVELTLALHHVFNSPVDKFIWDVGHQAYAHKIITGRRDQFPQNRQMGGISGFPNRSESPHDAFGTGHASTSISAGYGMVCARDLAADDYHVISVIGDGSMSGGLAFEGLNNAGASKRSFIVVLNDNKMSISPNVGALSKYLAYFITDPRMNRLKAQLMDFAGKLPQGERITRSWGRLENSIKAMLAPGMFFEQLGFRYIGPLDGHNTEDLINIFNKVKGLKGPILVHILSQKGKGYQPAEQNATQFHGIGSFDKHSGKTNGTSAHPSYTSVFGKTAVKLAEKHKSLVTITAAMTDGVGLTEFAAKYPQRFFDVGIAEGHAVTFAAGLAAQGYRPVVAIYSTFLQRGYDQIIHDAALQKLPIIFAVDRAGLVGDDGPTHHGCFDLAYLRNVPGITIFVPSDENELQHMLHTAVQWRQGPIVIRYPRGTGVGVHMDEEFKTLEPGKGEVARTGSDGAILTLGPVFWEAMAAAQLLEESGISLTVVNMRSLKPLDTGLLADLSERFGKIMTIEEGTVVGGFGSSVLENYSQMDGEIPKVKCLGLPDCFIEQGKRSKLLQKVGLDVEGIVLQARNFFAAQSNSDTRKLKLKDAVKPQDVRHHRQYKDAQGVGGSPGFSKVDRKSGTDRPGVR